jgi:hypothetical protein
LKPHFQPPPRPGHPALETTAPETMALENTVFFEGLVDVPRAAAKCRKETSGGRLGAPPSAAYLSDK